MKRTRITQLMLAPDGHALQGIMEGRKLYVGGLSFHAPGEVAHDDHRPHTHEDQECFIILQGEGWIELADRRDPVGVGDVLVIEPGEDHHVTSSEHNPLVLIWLHANEAGHPRQSGAPS